MKKIGRLLLVMLCCIALVACGNASEKNPETLTETEESTTEAVTDSPETEETEVENVLVISITINPELELYVTEELTVTKIVFKNQDAKEAFGDLKLENLVLMDCLFVMYDVAYEREYLQEGSHIDFSFVTDLDEEFAVMVKDEVWMTVQDFQERKQVEITFEGSITVSDGSSIPLTPDNQHGEDAENNSQEESSDSASDENGFKLVERDKNGNIIKTVQENAEGRDITILYTYDEENRLMTESVSQFDSLGRPSEFNKSYQYDTNGVIVSAMEEHANGVTVEYTYQNGSLYTKRSYNPENGYIQTVTYDNGMCVSDITEMLDGKYEKWYYNAAGILTERYGFTQSGRPIHSVYNMDGSYTSYITEEDGKTTIQYADADGNIIP